MLAYLFWHVPSAGIGAHEYEIALRDFLSDLTSAPPLGFVSCTSYRISEIPWLSNQEGYEDWYLVGSSGALDALNEAAVDPKRWDTHAAVASKMRSGHGGLYRHLYGDEQALGGASTLWLTRPQRIRYEDPLQKMIDGSAGFLSCWRRQMVLGPGDEFMIIGTSQFKVSVPQGWRARTVERAILPSDEAMIPPSASRQSPAERSGSRRAGPPQLHHARGHDRPTATEHQTERRGQGDRTKAPPNPCAAWPASVPAGPGRQLNAPQQLTTWSRKFAATVEQV